MVFVKLIILFGIFVLSIYIGIVMSKKFANRVQELKDMKNALSMFETKIKFTYEAVPDIFEEINDKIPNSIGQVFFIASKKMKEQSAGDAWIEAINETETNLLKEDIEIIKKLRKTFRENRCRWSNK